MSKSKENPLSVHIVGVVSLILFIILSSVIVKALKTNIGSGNTGSSNIGFFNSGDGNLGSGNVGGFLPP